MLDNSSGFFQHAQDSLEKFKNFFTLVGEKRWRWREIQMHEFGCKAWKDCHLYMDFYIHDYTDGSSRSCRSGLSQAKSNISVLRLQTWREEPNSAELYRSRGKACKEREGGPRRCLTFTRHGNATSAAISIVWSSCQRSQGPTAPKLPWWTVHFWRSPSSFLPWLGTQERKHKWFGPLSSASSCWCHSPITEQSKVLFQYKACLAQGLLQEKNNIKMCET